MKPLTREQAIATNDARPFTSSGFQTALPFNDGDKFAAPAAYLAAVDCLTAAIYYEAGGEPEEGQRAVAQVVLNRVRHPAFPPTVCQVVYQGSERSRGCQFTFTCDGSLARQPNRSGWERARRIAERALDGRVDSSVGMATHYHTNWVVPYWASNLDKIAAVGGHIFYRWRGYWGQRQAFSQHYAGEATKLPRLAYTEELLANWNDDATQATNLSAGHGAAWQDDHLGGQSPLIADQPLRELVADQTRGRLIAAGSPMSLPDARPLSPGS